ncbi:hypothetical protein [Streptomyces europaeiscabiei]|uniref:hypothetical protein n=1 Tax=Streptomyces europaeiscabiei TaxID=146819 RepID=UPI0038F681CE
MPDGPYEALAARLDDGRVIVVTQPTGRPVPDLVSYAREVPPHANSPACRFAAPEQHFSATVIRRSALVPPSPRGAAPGPSAYLTIGEMLNFKGFCRWRS